MSTIAGWLERHGLAQYVPVFAENVVDIDVLFDLTETDLEKLGIPLGDRKRILKAIAADQQRSTPQTSVPAATVYRRTRRPSDGISRSCFAILSAPPTLRSSLIPRR